MHTGSYRPSRICSSFRLKGKNPQSKLDPPLCESHCGFNVNSARAAAWSLIPILLRLAQTQYLPRSKHA